MGEWKEYRLGEICSRLSSGKNINAALVHEEGEYPVYGANGLRGYTDTYNFDGAAAIIGRQGAFCGNVKYVSGKAYMTEHAVVAVANEKSDSHYLAYLLSTMHLGHLSGQSAQPGLSVNVLSKQIISLPSIQTQRKIASILSTLDDKIAVNRRICENLEAQAQALFKHWFVDFAPFKDGKFVDSELGMIPEGWRVGKLEDIVEIRKPSIKPQEDTIYIHYSIPAFDDRQTPSLDEGSTIKSNKFGIENDAILLSKLNPNIKRIWFVGKVNENSVSSTEFLPFYAKNAKYSSFVYCYLNDNGNYREIANGAKGTTNSHQRIDAVSILNRKLAYSDEAIREFCVIVNNMMQLILEAQRESSRLSTLRDTLLPKLMSGQIKL